MPTTASASIFLGGQWFLPAVVLSMICFVAQPLLMHKDMNLELKRTLEPRVMSREELAKTGTVPRQEIIVAIGFMLCQRRQGICLLTGFNANEIGLGLIAFSSSSTLKGRTKTLTSRSGTLHRLLLHNQIFNLFSAC